MANRDMTQVQFSFEKHRKTISAVVYFGAAGAITLDGPNSKGVLSVTKVATPALAGLYTFRLGVNVNSINYTDTYIKSLILDTMSWIEYSGTNNPAATANVAVWRDDINNNLPIFGDVAPASPSVAFSGSGSGLLAVSYRWLVTAVDSNGNETQIATALTAGEPTGTPTAGQNAVLTYTAVQGAASYNIYRTVLAGGGAAGTENVFIGNTTASGASAFTDVGGAVTASYQSGVPGFPSKLPNSKLTANNNAIPPFGYGAITLGFYLATTLTNPGAGEACKLQMELGDSGAA